MNKSRLEQLTEERDALLVAIDIAVQAEWGVGVARNALKAWDEKNGAELKSLIEEDERGDLKDEEG